MTIDTTRLHHQSAGMRRLREQFPQAYQAGPLFHGTDLSPEQVLLDGIPATGGENFNLADHQRQQGQSAAQRSALRGSCEQAHIPAAFAGPGGYVYKFYPVGGGIHVNAALGDKHLDLVEGKLEGSLMPGEHEIAFASYQPGCQIEGYYVVGEYSDLHEKYRLGRFVANPHFRPLPAWPSSLQRFGAEDSNQRTAA